MDSARFKLKSLMADDPDASFHDGEEKVMPALSRTQVFQPNLGAVGTLVSNDQSLFCEAQDRDRRDLGR